MTEDPVDYVVRMRHGRAVPSTEHGAGRMKKTEGDPGREIARVRLTPAQALLSLDDLTALFTVGRLKP